MEAHSSDYLGYSYDDPRRYTKDRPLENLVPRVSPKNEMVGRRRTSTGSKVVSGGGDVPVQSTKSGGSAAPPASSKSRSSKVRSGFVAKRKYVDKGIQTAIDMDLTGGEASLSYWKELAENRRQALEEALKENEALHTRISELEKDNEMMEEMVQEAKAIAEVVSKLPNFSNADESGFDGEYQETDDNDCSINDTTS